MIITVNMSDDDVMELASICYKSSKIFITVKNKGLVGVFSIQATEHTGKEKKKSGALAYNTNRGKNN
jgi:hypothetical protein